MKWWGDDVRGERIVGALQESEIPIFIGMTVSKEPSLEMRALPL